MAFFDDRLAMPDRYGNDHAHTVEYGIRCVKMDPVIVLTTHPGCKYRSRSSALSRSSRVCRTAASCYRPMSRLPLIATSLSRSRRGTICRRRTTSVRSSRPVGSCLTESTSPMCFARASVRGSRVKNDPFQTWARRGRVLFCDISPILAIISMCIHDRAQHDPAFVRAIIAGSAVHRGQLVPHQHIADAPVMVINEAILR